MSVFLEVGSDAWWQHTVERMRRRTRQDARDAASQERAA